MKDKPNTFIFLLGSNDFNILDKVAFEQNCVPFHEIFPKVTCGYNYKFYIYFRGNPINQKLGYFLSRVSMLYYDHVCGTNRLSLREK